MSEFLKRKASIPQLDLKLPRRSVCRLRAKLISETEKHFGESDVREIYLILNLQKFTSWLRYLTTDSDQRLYRAIRRQKIRPHCNWMRLQAL